MSFLRKQLAKSHRRRGALTVEFALTAPILFAIVLGALEFSHINMVRNTMENAAYEGARQGIIPGATARDIRIEARTILRAVGISGQRIQIQPGSISHDTERVTVTVRVPLDRNGFIAPLFMKGKTLERSVTLTREALDYVPSGS